jgi:hypothetical protein
MNEKLNELNKSFYDGIDAMAADIANKLLNEENITKDLLLDIVELYEASKCEKLFENKNFEAAYHEAISSKMEFFISRILYHYSKLKLLGWKIYLRRQVGKTAPDVRIEKNGKTIAILELKAKTGWIQPLFSYDRFEKDMEKFKMKKTGKNPEDLIKRTISQMDKYADTFSIKKQNIFFIIPTLREAHRIKYNKKLEDYRNYFKKITGLDDKNIIILSNNLSLDLDKIESKEEYEPTNDFENFIKHLSSL